MRPIETKDLEPSWFTPTTELGKEEGDATRFKIRALNGEQLGEVLHGSHTSGDSVVLSPNGVNKALKHGLVEWENFNQEFSPFTLSTIPHGTRVELAEEILVKSILLENEVKNS